MNMAQKQDFFQLLAQATLLDCMLDAGLHRVFLLRLRQDKEDSPPPNLYSIKWPDTAWHYGGREYEISIKDAIRTFFMYFDCDAFDFVN